MKRLKQVIAFILSAALCTSAFPACNGNTVKLLFVFTYRANQYLNSIGMTQNQYADQMKTRLQTTIQNSVGPTAFVSKAGVMDYPPTGGIGFVGLFTQRDGAGLLGDRGAVEFAAGSPSILKERDNLQATHVVVVGEYDNTTVSGWTLPQKGCATGGPKPEDAFLGLLASQTANQNPRPNEISKQFIETQCGTADAGYASYYNLPYSPNCSIVWTMEMPYGVIPNGPRPNGNQATYTQSGTCWQNTFQSGVCYADPSNAVHQTCSYFAPAGNACSWSNGHYASASTWVETMTKSGYGTTNVNSTAQGTATYGPFTATCNTSGEQNRYSSSTQGTPQGAPLGDATHDNVAKLNANFGTTTCFGGMKLSGRPVSAVQAASGN